VRTAPFKGGIEIWIESEGCVAERGHLEKLHFRHRKMTAVLIEKLREGGRRMYQGAGSGDAQEAGAEALC